jgi:hypothetical protein
MLVPRSRWQSNRIIGISDIIPNSPFLCFFLRRNHIPHDQIILRNLEGIVAVWGARKEKVD